MQPGKECQEGPEVAAGGMGGSRRSQLAMTSHLEAYLPRYICNIKLVRLEVLVH